MFILGVAQNFKVTNVMTLKTDKQMKMNFVKTHNTNWATKPMITVPPA